MRPVRIAQIGINQYSHAVDIFHTVRSLPHLFEFVGYAPVEDEQGRLGDRIAREYAGVPELSFPPDYELTLFKTLLQCCGV